MDKEDAMYFVLSKSEQGKDGMTVVKLGYVYSLINKLFEEKTDKKQEEY